jgi:hypothetical protein
MKNIHILPTDKPSSLFEIDGHLIINKEQLIQPKYYRNIYITSDEEIKIGNWVLNIEENTIFKPSTYEIYHIKNSEAKYYEYCKKIILTTDHDLFKDGVQAINDEFHDWFVKNPSCESVKTKLVYDYEEHPELVGNPKEEWSYYKITIPKEESKNGSISECVKVIIDKQLSDIEELKQEVGKEFYESADKVITVKRQEKKPHSFCETPEEQCTMNYCDENGCQNRVRHLVESKQEQDKKMYSEEEVLDLLYKRDLYLLNRDEEIDLELPDKWFEQFKKEIKE